MIDEERVMTLLARANPEPEESFELDSNSAAYLATLQQRSSDMVQLDTRKPQERRGDRRWKFALALGTLAVVLGATWVLNSQSRDESSVATQPTPTTEAQPATTAIVDSNLADIPTWFGLGNPGAYQPSLFSVPFAFTLAESGWESGVDADNKFAICGPDVSGPTGARSACLRASAVAVFLLEYETVEDTQAYLGTFPGAEIANVEPISIDGAEGVRFSFTHELKPHSMPEGGYNGFPYWLHESQEIPLGADESIVTIVDVEGTVLTVAYQGRTITEPTMFDANLAEGVAIVDSIIWGN